MNTRSFFKSLALLTAGAAVAPGIFIPKLEPVRWKVAKPVIRKWVVEYRFNPKDYIGEWRWQGCVLENGVFRFDPLRPATKACQTA